MENKSFAQLSTELARELVEKGFEHKDIGRIIKEKTPFEYSQAKAFEERLYEKIEKFSKYLYVSKTIISELSCKILLNNFSIAFNNPIHPS